MYNDIQKRSNSIENYECYANSVEYEKAKKLFENPKVRKEKIIKQENNADKSVLPASPSKLKRMRR